MSPANGHLACLGPRPPRSGPCLFGENSSDLGDGSCCLNCCLYYVLSLFCLQCCLAGPKRGKLRANHGLQEAPCGDCCTHCWCGVSRCLPRAWHTLLLLLRCAGLLLRHVCLSLLGLGSLSLASAAAHAAAHHTAPVPASQVQACAICQEARLIKVCEGRGAVYACAAQAQAASPGALPLAT